MTKKTITVTQVKSAARREEYQAKCLSGLGLGKMNRTRVLEDTSAVRGLIDKIKHLLEIKEN